MEIIFVFILARVSGHSLQRHTICFLMSFQSMIFSTETSANVSSLALEWRTFRWGIHGFRCLDQTQRFLEDESTCLNPTSGRWVKTSYHCKRHTCPFVCSLLSFLRHPLVTAFLMLRKTTSCQVCFQLHSKKCWIKTSPTLDTYVKLLKLDIVWPIIADK